MTFQAQNCWLPGCLAIEDRGSGLLKQDNYRQAKALARGMLTRMRHIRGGNSSTYTPHSGWTSPFNAYVHTWTYALNSEVSLSTTPTLLSIILFIYRWNYNIGQSSGCTDSNDSDKILHALRAWLVYRMRALTYYLNKRMNSTQNAARSTGIGNLVVHNRRSMLLWMFPWILCPLQVLLQRARCLNHFQSRHSLN